ncbi:1499_t:CDS:2 [Ambispora leptoticha]|uniref:1499_t:CDS:1 n=1 Tax=Ambispora leptoticha TaxID=144679 RepID=A0A9N8ZLW6_9GLOM|nr:1499_t:CDS:2 [Ambispora leptoticha]
MTAASAFQIKLCNDIASFLENSNTHDVVIRVGEEKKEFRAHSTILCARSRYFQIGLSPEWSKKQNGQYMFEKPNVSPLIFEIILKWSQIDSRDFQQKVMPYKKVLPKSLSKNIIDHYLNSNIPIQSTIKARIPRAKLINSEIAAVIASWIDNQNSNYYNERLNPYKFELLFHASKDGFSSNTFHQKCDNKGATVVFAKLNSNEMIFGGYNPNSWKSDMNYQSCTTTFLFSFQNSQNIASAQIGRVKQNQCATYNYSSYGPTFGGGHDFFINGNVWQHNTPNHTYPSVFNNIRNGTLQEYEVFQVIKK